MNKNLSIFAPTADQRYLLGVETFLRTHYPMTVRTYNSNGELQLIEEESLLSELIQPTLIPGNRVWILYGAPGSGKSELLKWLETRVKQESLLRSNVMVRIARHELDISTIVTRFLHLLPNQFIQDAITQKWQDARQKPRTLTKLVLLFALENLFDSDEIINALFYRLLNVLHPFVERILVNNDEALPEDSSYIELISQEAWTAIVEDTILPITITYEQFRMQITKAFQAHLLEGVHLAETMSQISQYCHKEYGIRPILLVDDLVQSLNIFATDLLDYLLTLEAGNWDVVLGLTPAAFEDNQRGRNLLQRISYLDTIDDRVIKLWLSDEAGKESYILNEDNCHDFASYYLKEIGAIHTSPTLPYFPFNQEVLVRIYRKLPSGKGKIRYFVKHLYQILVRLDQGEELLDILVDFAQPEYIARIEDKNLARLCEFYGDLLQVEDTNYVILSPQLLSEFSLSGAQTKIKIEPLVRFYVQQQNTTQMLMDESQLAVRDWLLGKSVNRQLLKKLRQGATRWLRTISRTDWLYKDNVAKPKGALRWRKTYLGTGLPICIDGIDEDLDGILLTREIGMIAFDLCQYADCTGSETKVLQRQLAQSPELLLFQLRANNYRTKKWQQLEAQLCISLEELALGLYIFYLAVHGYNSQPLPRVSEAFVTWLNSKHQHYRWHREMISAKSWQTFITLFTDIFELRHSLYDGYCIQTLIANNAYQALFEQLCDIRTEAIAPYYILGHRPLKNVLDEVQNYIAYCESVTQKKLSTLATNVLQQLISCAKQEMRLAEIPQDILDEIKIIEPDKYVQLYVYIKD